MRDSSSFSPADPLSSVTSCRPSATDTTSSYTDTPLCRSWATGCCELHGEVRMARPTDGNEGWKAKPELKPLEGAGSAAVKAKSRTLRMSATKSGTFILCLVCGKRDEQSDKQKPKAALSESARAVLRNHAPPFHRRARGLVVLVKGKKIHMDKTLSHRSSIFFVRRCGIAPLQPPKGFVSNFFFPSFTANRTFHTILTRDQGKIGY